ncbi:MAG: dihydrodipicolinate synthase family protein [Gemmatimonadota bacterium]|nr:dihydrodipicolinate synthase family protein [Gemmatimonadota bacterium]
MTENNRYGGVLVPVTTPFESHTGDVDLEALTQNVKEMLNRGADGVLVAGSTGESAMLSDDECRRMVGALRDNIPAKAHLMIGAGLESTRATIAACNAGGKEGANTALVRAPSYFSSSLNADSLVEHFTRVADESPIPVFLYNMPKYTHIDIDASVVERLSGHTNIHGAKDSCGDINNFAVYREAAPDWAFFVGSGALLNPAMELGAVGGILAVANFATRLSADIYSEFIKGDKHTSKLLQERLTPLHKGIVQGMGPAGVKRAMDFVGLAGGPMRPPLRSVDDAKTKEVADLLSAAEIETVAP